MKQTNNSGGIGFMSLLQIVFITLKLTKKFYDTISQLLWLGYVDLSNYGLNNE